MSFKIKQLMNMQRNLEPEVVRAIMALAHSISFTDTLYVSAAGDNSDGSSWNRAYTSLKTALDWIEANQTTGEAHLIMLGIGTWDINTTGDPTYSKNISISAVDRYNTIIRNTHASATSVLKFENCMVHLTNLIWNCNTNNHGIVLDNCEGSVFINVTGLGDSLTAAKTVLDVQNTTYFYMHDSVFAGDVAGANATVLKLDSSSRSKITGCRFWFGLIAIHITGTGSYNYFTECHVLSAATGVTITVNQSNTHFHRINFHACTINAADAGTSTLFAILYIHPKGDASVHPADLTGQIITAAAGANNWTAVPVEIRSAAAATKPFYIIGLVYEPDTLEKWGVRLSDDGGTTWFVETILEAAANRSNRILFTEKYFISQSTAIHGAVKSETGGNNMDLWLIIEIV